MPSSSSAGRARAVVALSLAAVPVVVTAVSRSALAFDLQNLQAHAIALTARNDQYGPGATGLGGITTFGALSFPQINNAGQVVINGMYQPGGTSFAGGSPDGVWRFGPGTGLEVVARTATGGAPFGPSRPSVLDTPLLSSDGAVYLRAFNGIPQEGLFRFTSTSTGLVPLALSGTTNATGPGLAGLSYASNSTSALPNNLLARGSHAAHEASLTVAGTVTFNNDSVLSRATSGGPNTVLVREDSATPAPFASNRWFSNQDLGALNASGDVAFLSAYNVGQFGTSVWARYVAATDSVQIIAASGNSGALGPGSGTSAVFMSGAGSIGMNDAGDAVFMSRIDSGGNPIYLSRRRVGDTSNILLAKGANPQVTSNFQTNLGNGDTMGLPSGRRLNRFESTASPVIAGDGSIFVTGTITGGNSSSRALWKHTDATGFRPIVITDDSTTHAALLGSGVRVDQVHSLAANSRGNLAFFGQLFGTGVTTTNDLAVLAYADDQLSVVVRKGQLFDADPTSAVSLKTIADIAIPYYALTNTGGQDGRRTYFNDNNQLALTLRFTDSSQGTFVIAVPEPAALSLLTLPGLALVRRRR